MNFREAHEIVGNFHGGPTLSFLLATSGGTHKLDLFLKAAGAKRGRAVEARTLEFNTLGQALLNDGASDEREVFVLFPWDLVPEGDWRSGVPSSTLDLAELQARAQATAERLASRRNAAFLYVAAPLPPLFADSSATLRLGGWLASVVLGIGATLLPADAFSLASYLSNGSPFASATLGSVADAIVERAVAGVLQPKKVLVTDLDNVMWHGVIGEDGLGGIQFSAEGTGFRHFIYQTFLLKLKREGALLAAVSRNDTELANSPFVSDRMVVHADDLVAIVASYSAKSAQIREIAQQLNLGLDSFVFVDDNVIEIEEVSGSLADVKTVVFPSNDDSLPSFLAELSALFSRATVTAEDVERTAMYRRRLETMVPAEVAGADLTAFLRGLQMSLTIHDRSRGDRERAVQLINKTNQFNINGRRVADGEVANMLAAGGRLYTCSLSDRTGSHGEILSCLIDGSGTIRSLVMSCRVFQRRVEHAFLVWLGGQGTPPRSLEFVATPRNEPIVRFLGDSAFSSGDDGLTTVDWEEFTRANARELELFALSAPEPSQTTDRS